MVINELRETVTNRSTYASIFYTRGTHIANGNSLTFGVALYGIHTALPERFVELEGRIVCLKRSRDFVPECWIERRRHKPPPIQRAIGFLHRNTGPSALIHLW